MVNVFGIFVVVGLAQTPRLRSSRFPHASLLGERISGSRKVSKASAASSSQPVRTPCSGLFLGRFDAGLLGDLQQVRGELSYHLCARRPRSPGTCGRSAAATKQTWAMRSASTRKDRSNSSADSGPSVGIHGQEIGHLGRDRYLEAGANACFEPTEKPGSLAEVVRHRQECLRDWRNLQPFLLPRPLPYDLT